MELIYYLLYLAVTWLLLMFIYRFSTYHGYFAFAIPIFIIYSILIAYFLFLFALHQFFLWHIFITLILLLINYRKNKKSMSVFREDQTQKIDPEIELPFEKTLKHHILSSIIYLVTFSFSYLYFYNS